MKYQVKGMEYHDTYFVSHLRLARQQFLTCDGEGSHHAIRKGLQIMNQALTRGPSFLLDVLHLSSSILCGRHEDLGVSVAWSSSSAREQHSGSAGEQQRDEHQLHCHLRYSSVKK